ncbi:MAG: DUF2339 domain-containing protein [Hyphomicrobiales bacterium]
MESLILLLLGVLGVLFILPVVSIVSVNRLRSRVEELGREIERLKAVAGSASPAARPVEPEAPSSPAATEEPIPAHEEPQPADEPGPAQEAAAPSIPLSMGGAGQRRRSMEQTLGTRWTVWVGGLALALGGVFLVKYSIEAGLLGPGVRILLGALFAAALAAAGEYLRRRETGDGFAGVPSAYIPGVLTAAAILSAFATVYAAYALYGFLNPLAAFVLLAAVSLASLSISWLHGPGLAGLGLIGSYATPLLVASEKPAAWPLFLYLLFVTAAAFLTARMRGWLWLAASATAGAVLWGLVWGGGSWSPQDIAPFGFYILALTAIAFGFLAYGVPGEEAEARTGTSPRELLAGTDWVATAVIAAITLLLLPAVRLDGYGNESLLLMGAVILALLGGAWYWRNLSTLAVWAAALFGAIYASWHLPVLLPEPVGPFDAYMGLPEQLPPALRTFLAIGGVFGGLFAAAGFYNALTARSHAFWTIVSAGMPILIFAYAYLRATGFTQDLPFATAGLAIALGYVLASEVMYRQGPDHPWGWRSGCYAAAAVIALALACTMALDKGWLTIALALICPGLGWVALNRPVPGLRYLAAGMAAAVMARLAWDPLIAGDAVGETPVFNWLLYGYGVPALAFAAASVMFRRQKDDRVVQILEAASILCAVVLIGLQIRHLLNEGDVYSPIFGLWEQSIHTIALLGLAVGLQRLYDRTGRVVVEKAAAILGIAGLAAILLGHLLLFNPLFTNESVGTGLVFNLVFLGYLVPALLCGVLYYMSRGRHPYYLAAIGATALLLAFAWLTLENRVLYQGEYLARGATSDAEWYTYSAIWLAFGAALLAGGILTGVRALRFASLAVILLTVAKVFLSDMDNLEGILRALSFIGLGAVLIAVGYFYQRFVFPRPAAEPAEGPAEGETGEK